MGTLTEEIFSRKLGREVKAGEIVWVELDRIMSHDTMSWLAIEAMRKVSNELGIEAKPKFPERIVIPFDHILPPANIDQAKMQRNIMNFIKEHKLPHFFQEGVCHQIMIEKGFVQPGNIIIGSDSHTCSYGALGAFGTGMGSTDVGIAYATGRTWFRVPESILINVTGEFQEGVYAKDLILKIIATLGVDGATYKSLEFRGDAITRMSIPERITLCNMAIECGAKAGLIEADEKTVEYLQGRTTENVDINNNGIIKANNGNYEQTFNFNISELEPQIACPHDLDNLKPISEVEGLELHQVFIGTCTNGRYEDLEIAANILRGKRVNRFTRTIVIPASTEVFQKANESGFIKIFQDAGCIVCNPGCGPCIGRHQGTMASGEVALTTMNRNFKGRMGSPEAEIYLGSPAVCAASAIEGKITDPRKRREE
ncbi:3-isopropylmalate dehydratase large subunit [Candidatus Woesearchaeota archaeon]|jgi:3-isopropylmalate dehydratase large subunit|nr:3-isopropylmalate dehydratase large subunit [Candidatus Woesearchaeota archaeon]MBT7926897.1 3-isopropylmalate dehydratase large subunit [Candidatus Woesearchaeota archaeon]